MSPQSDGARVPGRSYAWLVVLAGVLVASPTVGLGLTLFDDALQRDLIQAHLRGERSDAWYDLFTWIDGDPERARLERSQGLRPWWSADDVQVRFLRPLAAASHYLDNLLWPRAPWAMHLHSVLWYGVACLWALWMCGTLDAHRRTVLLGGLIYALDDAHVRTVAWLAQRNAWMGAALSFLALHLWARRAGSARESWLASLVLVAALACSEGSVAVLAYAFAHVVVFERRGVAAGARRLAPLLLVCIAWFVVYRELGFGTRGSGTYVQPTEAAYWQYLPSRLLALLAGQLQPPPMLVQAAFGRVAYPVHLLLTAILGLLLCAGLAFRRERVVAFWALAALGALLPAATAQPDPRLLAFAGPALAMLSAHAIAGLVTAFRAGEGALRWVPLLLCAPLLLTQLVLAPAEFVTDGARFEQDASVAAAQLPALGPAPELAGQHLVVLFTPSMINATAIPAARARRGWSVPVRFTILAAGTGSVSLTRHGADGLALTGDGLLDDPLAVLWRGPSRPMQRGQRFSSRDFDAAVLAVTPDGRPAHVVFHMAAALGDPRLRLIAWRGARYEDVALPPEGKSLRFP